MSTVTHSKREHSWKRVEESRAQSAREPGELSPTATEADRVSDEPHRAAPRSTPSTARKRKAGMGDKQADNTDIIFTPGAGPSCIRTDIRPTYERPDSWKTLRFKKTKRAHAQPKDGRSHAVRTDHSSNTNAVAASTTDNKAAIVQPRTDSQPSAHDNIAIQNLITTAALRAQHDRHSPSTAERSGALYDHALYPSTQRRGKASAGNLRAPPINMIDLLPTPMSMSPAPSQGMQSPAPTKIRRDEERSRTPHPPHAPPMQRAIEDNSKQYRATPCPNLKSPTPGLQTPISLRSSSVTPQAQAWSSRMDFSTIAPVQTLLSPRLVKPLPAHARSSPEWPPRGSLPPIPRPPAPEWYPGMIREMVEAFNTPCQGRPLTPICSCCTDEAESHV